MVEPFVFPVRYRSIGEEGCEAVFARQIASVRDVEIHISERLVFQEENLEICNGKPEHHDRLVRPERVIEIHPVFLEYSFLHLYLPP